MAYSMVPRDGIARALAEGLAFAQVFEQPEAREDLIRRVLLDVVFPRSGDCLTFIWSHYLTLS
jgi:hypothetical protein